VLRQGVNISQDPVYLILPWHKHAQNHFATNYWATLDCR